MPVTAEDLERIAMGLKGLLGLVGPESVGSCPTSGGRGGT